MQTFLPYADLRRSLECLDYRRLGKQRVESRQIISIFENELVSCLDVKVKPVAWSNHPATKMWKGYTKALKYYYNLNLQEWENRGYRNIKLKPFPLVYKLELEEYPPWWGGPIHSSHRSALLYKKYDYYKQFGWEEKPKLEYVWPLVENK